MFSKRIKSNRWSKGWARACWMRPAEDSGVIADRTCLAGETWYFSAHHFRKDTYNLLNRTSWTKTSSGSTDSLLCSKSLERDTDNYRLAIFLGIKKKVAYSSLRLCRRLKASACKKDIRLPLNPKLVRFGRFAKVLLLISSIKFSFSCLNLK